MKQQAQTEVVPAQLGAEQQYRSLLLTFPRFTQAQEQALIERALAGEPVRNDLIVSLQGQVYHLAHRLASKSLRGKEQATERMDLVQEANRAMLKRFSRALTKENPCSYLLKVARLTMIDCIRTLDASGQQAKEDDTASALLDGISLQVQRQASRQSKATHALLYQAITTLPEKQRLVIVRCYGLGGAPESLNAISRSLSSTSSRHAKNAYHHHKRALVALKEHLTVVLSPVATGGAE